MKLSSTSLLLTSLLACAAAACSSAGDDDDSAGNGDCGSILAGDLVITEVMANPAGADQGNEYFEIYSAGDATLDLTGLTLAYSLPDGSRQETHEVDGLSVEPGGYVTLGAADPEALADFMDYGFGNDLGTLRNAGALLALRCGDTEIDRAGYPSQEGSDGVAVQLDGASAPDYLANDDPANFCPATTEFATGMFGSPGAANQPCDPPPVTTCLDGGEERDAVPPQLGDLVITEFMASPNGPDDTNEWFEVVATRDVDLNGVVAGREAGSPGLTVGGEDCIRLAAGRYALFARSDAAAANGGLPAVTATFGFSLVGAGSLYIGLGDAVLDQITWAAAEEGASTALDPDSIDPVGNDDPASWITCTAPYGDVELANTGTPGASNEACGGGPVEGTCMDGGRARPIVPPTAGRILVTEALANPANPRDVPVEPEHEWFELTALADFDLNGLQLGKADAVSQTLSSATCLSVASGTRLVFAESSDPGINGGLPRVDFLKDFQLNNSGGSVFVALDGVELHRLSYGAGVDGRATQLDPDGQTLCTTPETDPYGTAGDLGTPGAANPECPPTAAP